MPNDNKCEKKACDAPSDNSEVCHEVKCEKKCEKDCCIKQCKEYRPEEILCQYKDAVVEIHSEFILFGASGPTAGSSPQAVGAQALSANARFDTVLEGNGFFIKGHYIVAPAHLVLLPPSLTSVAVRYPFDGTNQVVNGTMQNKYVRASRILVSVFNVNGKGHSFVYEADLVGVDGAGDIAVLRINFKKQWNLCNPCIEKCHPYLQFGSSRGSKDGEKVYLLGDYVGNQFLPQNFAMSAVGAVSDGLLSDHRHLDYAGWILPELVLVSAPAYAQSSGLPILNAQGQVIGMQTTDLSAIQEGLATAATGITGAATGTVSVAGQASLSITSLAVTGGYTATALEVVTGEGTTGAAAAAAGTIQIAASGVTGSASGAISATGPANFLVNSVVPGQFLQQQRGFGFVSGPSEFFMKRVIKELIKGTCSRKFNCQLTTVCDPVGSYYVYNKAYAGLAYNVFTGKDYDYTINYNAGAAPNGQPRIRLSTNGEFLNAPSCKELVGVRVVGLAGLNPTDSASAANGFFYVPGGTASAPLANGLPVSPFLGKLQPGDVITHINGVALGDLEKQIAPSLITWRLCENDQIEICYRRGGNFNGVGANDSTDNYDNLFTNTVCLAAFPPLMDYPWYAVNKFPLLGRGPYPGFVFPATQLQLPQLPALTQGARFHPAL